MVLLICIVISIIIYLFIIVPLIVILGYEDKFPSDKLIMKNLILLLVKAKELWYNNVNIPKASTILLIKDGKILSVSRKNNHSQKGLVGGKVDPGETFKEAAIREAYEETGYKCYNLKPVFTRRDGDFMAVVYLADFDDNETHISEKETGLVEWVDFCEIEKGPFGIFNKQLHKRLAKLGIAI